MSLHDGHLSAPPPDLPAHLAGITSIAADADAAGTPMARRIRQRLPHVPFRTLAPGDPPPEDSARSLHDRTLHLKRHPGAFLKNCPGTRAYHCCGYRIIHMGENCPLSCSYCILQAYFQSQTLRAFVNTDDMHEELEAALTAASSVEPGRRFRLGTGEFTDSLCLEYATGLSAGLVDLLTRFDNVRLELKSKIVDLSWMEAAHRPETVLPAWSVNAPRIVTEQEVGAASLEERLAAARTCAREGFRVCLHFDPIIRYPGWREGYARTVEMIGDHLRPRDVAYISLGSFRHMPPLKAVIEARHPGATYIYDEYRPGLDGKMRLLRPLRVRQFRFVADALQRIGMGDALYFCMESTEVWKAVLGYAPRDRGGLARILTTRAFTD